MPIREYIMDLGTNGDSICVRAGLDAVSQCRANKNKSIAPKYGATEYSNGLIPFRPKPFQGRYCNVPPGPTTSDVCVNIKVWDCDVLQKTINPYCTFATPNNWIKKVNAEIRANRGYTIRFWWKAMKTTSWASIDKGLRHL